MTALLGLLAGCSTIRVEGRVVDGLDGQPIAGPYRIKARALDEKAAMSCQFVDAEVDAEGRFELDRLCPGTSYALETDRDDIWFVEVDQIPDGGWEQPTDLTAWRVPKGSGLYELSNDTLEALRTDTDVKTETILGTTEKVKYPATIPNNVTHVGPDEYLVMVGAQNVDGLKIRPLVASGVRRFGDAEVMWTMEPWSYVGVKFTDDDTYEQVEARLDPGKVVDKAKGDRKARFVSGSALPPGRYAVLRDDDKRMYVIDFGVSQSASPPASPAPAAAAP